MTAKLLELYKQFKVNPSITEALDSIANMDVSTITAKLAPSVRHRFKMKTKRLRKKLFTYPHRYYEKAYADILVYTMNDIKMQVKFANAMHALGIYGNMESSAE